MSVECGVGERGKAAARSSQPQSKALAGGHKKMRVEFGEEEEKTVPVRHRPLGKRDFRVRSYEAERKERRRQERKDFWRRVVKRMTGR